MFQGISRKMTSAIVVAVFVTAIATTVITSILVSYTLNVGMRTRLEETAKILRAAVASRTRDLATRAEVLAGDEDFQKKYAVRSVDLDGLKSDLAERLPRLHASLVYVSEPDGAKVADAEIKGAPRADQLGASVALAQARGVAKVITTVEHMGDAIWAVAAVPIQYGEQTLGYLVAAQPIDQPSLRQFQEATGADVILAYKGKVVGSTIELTDQAPLAAIDDAADKQQDTLSLDGLMTQDGSAVGSVVVLRAGNKVQGALVGAISGREMKQLRWRLLGASVGLALLTMVLSGLLGLFIARRIAGPIVEIEQSFREIAASGDLSLRITRHYDDEVGLLASSFNQMQERIAQLHLQVATAEKRMRSELQMASAVQEMLFPTQVIDGARCQVASHLQTSSETGGDWFTLLHAPEKHLTTAVVCDVTGHGAPAALVTAILYGFFKANQDQFAALQSADWATGTHEILLRLNAVLIEATRGSLVSSLLFFAFDHQTLRARYINAGHLTPIIARNASGKPTIGFISMSPSSLIGDQATPTFVSGEVQLAPGDLFLLYTDGIVECTNEKQEQYGPKRLRRVIEKAAGYDARTACDTILTDALRFFGEAPKIDDITLVVGKVR